MESSSFSSVAAAVADDVGQFIDERDVIQRLQSHHSNKKRIGSSASTADDDDAFVTDSNVNIR